MKRDPLNDQEINLRLSSLSGWTLNGLQLEKEFLFESYSDGLVFAQNCGQIAEELNHHPEILIRWKKVALSVTTHSCGGITELDFVFVQKVEATLNRER